MPIHQYSGRPSSGLCRIGIKNGIEGYVMCNRPEQDQIHKYSGDNRLAELRLKAGEVSK